MTDLINRGKHAAHVRSVQFGYAGKDDKEQIVVGFELTNTEDPDSGRFISAFLFLTDATFDRTVESLRHCGWTGDDFSELPGLVDSGGLDNEVELVVDHEEWDNKWQAKVKWINKPGSGGAVTLKKPLDGDALAKFGAQMKNRVRAIGAPQQRSTQQRPTAPRQQQTTAQRHPNAPGADDDLPF